MDFIQESKELSYIYSQLSRDIKNIESSIKVIENGIDENEQDVQYVIAYIESNLHACKFLRTNQPIIPLQEYRKILKDIAAGESHLKAVQKSIVSLKKLLKERYADLAKSKETMEKFINSIHLSRVISYEDYIQKRRR